MKDKKPDKKAFFDAAVQRFMPTILSRVYNKSEAEDIFQDTMKEVLERWNKIIDPTSYSWKIIHHSIIKSLKEKKLLSIDNIEIEVEISGIKSQDESWLSATREYEGLLTEVINSFPPVERERLYDLFLSNIKYNPKTKKNEKMSPDEFCVKHSISRRTYTNMIQKVRAEIERIIRGGDLPNNLQKNS